MQIASHLVQDETAAVKLSSRQHVIVVMEILGQAFGLDVADEKIIHLVTELYRRWILTDSKPQPIKDDEEFFFIVCA